MKVIDLVVAAVGLACVTFALILSPKPAASKVNEPAVLRSDPQTSAPAAPTVEMSARELWVQIPPASPDCEELKATIASLEAKLADEESKNMELAASLRAAEEGRDALVSLVLDQSVAVPLGSYGLKDPTDEDRHAFVSFVSRTGYVPPADVIVQYLTVRRAHEARMDEWNADYAALPLGQDDPGYPEIRDRKTAILADWRLEVERIFGNPEIIRRLFGE